MKTRTQESIDMARSQLAHAQEMVNLCWREGDGISSAIDDLIVTLESKGVAFTDPTACACICSLNASLRNARKREDNWKAKVAAYMDIIDVLEFATKKGIG